jgi:hypothetical protein
MKLVDVYAAVIPNFDPQRHSHRKTRLRMNEAAFAKDLLALIESRNRSARS